MENGSADNIGHVTFTLDNDEKAVLRRASDAWHTDYDTYTDDEGRGWRNASDLSPDTYLVLDWGKLTGLDLLETRADAASYWGDAQYRITKAGRVTLKAIDDKQPRAVINPEADAYARGRADAEREIQQQLYAMFGDDCNWREPSQVPDPLGALKRVKQALGSATVKQFQLESILASRDKVDEWAAALLETAAEAHVANHGERRGHMTLVAALLRRYVGSRNVHPEPPDPRGIPF